MPGLSAEWLSFLQMLPLPSQSLQDTLAFLSRGSWGETQAHLLLLEGVCEEAT